MKYETETCLIIDSGYACSIAEKLSEDFGKTYYITPTLNESPEHKHFAKGLGLGKIIKMDEMGNPIKFWDKVEEASLIITPEVGFGDIADYIRRHHPEKRVFGCGRADILEENRLFLKQIQEKVGLPVQPYLHAVGMKDLRAKLSKMKDCHVKPFIFRGDRETFHFKSMKESEDALDDMESTYGIGKHYQQFLIEPGLDALGETGCDLFLNGRDYIKPYHWGIERHAPYLGKWDDKLPEPLAQTMEAFKEILIGYDYRGVVATEELIISEDEHYPLDLTVRFPMPMGVMWTETITNFAEVIWKVAGGEEVEIIPAAKYVGCLPFESDYASDHWLRLLYNKKFKKNIKLLEGCTWDGKTYAVKGTAMCVVLIAWGKSPKEVIYQLEELSHEIEADDLVKDLTPLYKILEDFKTLEEVGIYF